MKHKNYIGLFTIFLIVASLACVYASDVTFNSMKITIPDDFKETSSNDTEIVLDDDHKQIIVTSEVVGEDAVASYLSSKGFTLNESMHCNTTINGKGQFEYDLNTYAKDGAVAAAYFLVKNDKEYTVIAIDSDFDEDDDYQLSDLATSAASIVEAIMLS